MSHRPILRALRTSFLIQAAVLSVLALWSISVAKAQAISAHPTWTVTVDVSGGGNPPTYPVSPSTSAGNCGAHQNDQRTLYACGNDTVLFQANLKSYDLYIAPDALILLDPTTAKPIPVLHVTDHDKPLVKITSDPSVGKIHEYRVALLDHTNHHLYVDDPQIVIGTGTTFSEIKALQTNCQTLSRSLLRTPDVQRQVNDLCKQIDHLARSLGTR